MKTALDKELAEQYGSYAGYVTEDDPILVETFGDGPEDEIERLLDIFTTEGTKVLDLGCGAGHTLCRLAPQVKAIWGFDQNSELLAAARERVNQLALDNVALISGNVAVLEDVNQLPDNIFDLVLSRRGPNLNDFVVPKLKSDAFVIQELFQDPLGLKEIFGRAPFIPQVGKDPHPLINHYTWLGLLAVSVKDYFFELYFRDQAHLAAYLKKEAMLSHWRMPDKPYNEQHDYEALNLFARYNKTAKGIRVVNHHQVYLFRRCKVNFYPAFPNSKPLY